MLVLAKSFLFSIPPYTYFFSFKANRNLAEQAVFQQA